MHDKDIDIDAILAMDNRIVSVKVLPDSHLGLRYMDGKEYILDFRPYIRRGGVMTALEEFSNFSAVRTIHDGRALEFPGGIDFCADSLRVDAELQKQSG